jgi:hypothetical protein
METDTLTAVREVLQWVEERHRTRKAHDVELGEESKNKLQQFRDAATELNGVNPGAVTGALRQVVEFDKENCRKRLAKDKTLEKWAEFLTTHEASKGEGAFDAAAELLKQARLAEDPREVLKLMTDARDQLLKNPPKAIKPGDVPGAPSTPPQRAIDAEKAVAALKREDLFKLIARNDTWGNFDATRALGSDATEADLKVLLNVIESAMEADQQDAAWRKYETEVGEAIKKRNATRTAPKVYKEVILGAGASAAYYIASNFGKFDMNSTMLLGNIQPWAGERGEKGNINHPHNQVDPQQKGEQPIEDKDEGLAERAEFSRRVAVMIDKLPHTKCTITKVRRCPNDFFEIETSEGKFYANKVTNALGIGKQKKPTGITAEAEAKTKDMDTFKRDLDGKSIKQAYPAVKSVCVSGGNAAIDVITALIRDQGKTVSDKLDIHWIVGESSTPAFLSGTDNALAAEAYPKGQSLASGKPIKKDNMTVYRGYLTAASGADRVTVTCTYKAPTDSNKDATSAHAIVVDLVVYGTGPDVKAMQDMFVDETTGSREKPAPLALETVVDKDRHYEVQIEEKDPAQLIEKLGLPKGESRDKLLEYLQDPSLKNVTDKVSDVVVGLKSQDGRESTSSMQFVGASGARLDLGKDNLGKAKPNPMARPEHETMASLPENVVGNDQLTPSRSRIEAQFNALPTSTDNVPLVATEGGVNFITGNQTVIRVHIAQCYPKIPPGLGDYVTGQIIFERSRRTPDGEKPKTPIPMPSEGDRWMENLSLDQQRAFQKKWTDRLKDISVRIS